jgi:hypothetical protein
MFNGAEILLPRHFLFGGPMSEENAAPKWNVEKVHKEVSEARNRLFVVAKVMETGSVDFKDQQEWAMVVRPLLTDLRKFADQIESKLGDL